MQLSERQQQQVEAIASLVTQPDMAAIRQGVELAAALGDQDVFARLLDGLVPAQVGTRVPNHRRFPTPDRATRFASGRGNQAWLDLAMLHLLAASDLPVKAEITSIALGTPNRRFADPAPTLWLDGLERLSALTHLDLHLNSVDRGLDLGALERFASLTHLRIGGAALPGPIPSMKHLEDVNGPRITFESGAAFPALRSVRGRIYSTEPLSPETMPNLVSVEARDGVNLAGFSSLERLWCVRGDYEVLGCRRIEHLRVNASSFHAPDLRHVGVLDRLGESVVVSQLETLGEVKLNLASRLTGGEFPDGTRLADPKVVLYGPAVTDLVNVGELSGMEVLLMTRIREPISLEPLRHATDLRVLDIRNSPGITDLSPLAELPRLEVLVMTDRDRDRYDIPAQLVDLVQKSWRSNQREDPNDKQATKQA